VPERLLELFAMARMAGALEIGHHPLAVQFETLSLDVPSRFRALLIAPALFSEFLLRGDVFAFPAAGHASILRRTKLRRIRSMAIQQEIRQTKPFQSPAHEAAVSLLRTANLLVRHYTAVVEQQGITLQQYNVLRILRGAGAAGLPTLEIGQRMVEQTPGITRLIDRLEKRGFVDRKRGEDDRRQVLCQITAAGLHVLAELDGPVGAADASGMAALDQAALAEFVRLLEEVRGGLRQLLDE
jgi:DNA-binding MarR family transcriptional regulator